MSQYVRIQNQTRGTIVAERCRVARSLLQRVVGLLGTPEPPRGEGLLIERAQSIHMFFMPYAIDVAFLDRGGRVTRCIPALHPWQVVWWARGARDCIELGVGTLESSATTVGDRLLVEPVG